MSGAECVDHLGGGKVLRGRRRCSGRDLHPSPHAHVRITGEVTNEKVVLGRPARIAVRGT